MGPAAPSLVMSEAHTLSPYVGLAASGAHVCVQNPAGQAEPEAAQSRLVVHDAPGPARLLDELELQAATAAISSPLEKIAETTEPSPNLACMQMTPT